MVIFSPLLTGKIGTWTVSLELFAIARFPKLTVTDPLPDCLAMPKLSLLRLRDNVPLSFEVVLLTTTRSTIRVLPVSFLTMTITAALRFLNSMVVAPPVALATSGKFII